MFARILITQFRGAILSFLAVAILFVLGVTTVSAQGRKSAGRGAEPAAISRGLLPAQRPAETVIPIVGGRRDSTLELMRVLGGTGGRVAAAAAKKTAQEVGEWRRSIDYSGPRFGVTYLPKSAVDSLKAHNIDVGSTITQFGWQLEREIHVSADGPMVLNEWVFLAGGLERGVFLPSATWLIGARGKSGNEIGFGPNVSVAGVGLAAAGGITMNSGGLHFPMNVAAASSRGGVRVSFLTGFTLH